MSRIINNYAFKSYRKNFSESLVLKEGANEERSLFMSLVKKQHFERYYFAVKYIANICPKKNITILDAACGDGYGSRILARNGWKVYGIDKSAPTKKSNKVIFKNMKCENLIFPDKFFDYVVSFETVEHIKDYEKFLDEIKRVTKTMAIISTPNSTFMKELLGKYHTKANPAHVYEFGTEELYLILKKRFKSVDIYNQDEIIKGSRLFTVLTALSRLFRYPKIKLKRWNTTGITNIYLCRV